VQQGQTGPLVFLAFDWFAISSDDARTTTAVIAIFLIGMHYIENSFKLFSGDTFSFPQDRKSTRSIQNGRPVL